MGGGVNCFDFDVSMFKKWQKTGTKIGLLDNLIFSKMRIML